MMHEPVVLAWCYFCGAQWGMTETAFFRKGFKCVNCRSSMTDAIPHTKWRPE